MPRRFPNGSVRSLINFCGGSGNLIDSRGAFVATGDKMGSCGKVILSNAGNLLTISADDRLLRPCKIDSWPQFLGTQ